MSGKGLTGISSAAFLLAILIFVVVTPAFGIWFSSYVNPNNANASETNLLLNFSVNHSTDGINITEVNITLPFGFGYIGLTNATTTDTFFINHTDTLSWYNKTPEGFIDNTTPQYFSFNVSVPSTATTYNFNVTTKDTNNSYYSRDVSFTVNDNNYPFWSGNSSSLVTNYSLTQPNIFNISWNDSSSIIDTVLISIWNSSGYYFVNNTTMSGSGTYGYAVFLPVGSYNWTSFANDSTGKWNSSGNWFAGTISKGTNNVNLYFGETLNSNKTYFYPNPVNVTANCSGGTVYLYRDGSSIDSGSTATDNNLFGHSNHTYSLNATGNANFSDNTTGVTFYITVNKGIPDMTIMFRPNESVEYPEETNVTGIENNVGDVNMTYTFWRDSTLVKAEPPYEEVATLNAGTYEYRLNTSGGENWSANSTGYVATLTVTGEEFIPGGGSGVIPIPRDVTRTPGKVNVSIPSIPANRTLNLTIVKTEDVAIRKLTINVVKAVKNVRLLITKLSRLPSTLSHNINGRVYNYISIEHENIEESDMNNTIIRFAVNKTWMEARKIVYTNISLYRWEFNDWVELSTGNVSEDGFEVYYEAVSPGFSYFVIGTSGGSLGLEEEEGCEESWSCTGWSGCVNSTQTRTCTDANECNTTSTKPSELQTCDEEMQSEVQTGEEFPLVTVAAIALAIILVVAVLIYLKSRKKIKFIYSKEDYY